MKSSIRNSAFILIPLVTLLLGWGLGVRYEQQNVAEERSKFEDLLRSGTGSGTIAGDPEKEVDLSLFWGVWRLLQKHYIATDKLQTLPMLYGATSGLVEGIGDPYTSFMTPKENTDFQQSLEGKLQGVGAELTMKNEQIVIVSPLKGSPAEKAGLLPGDIVTGVDGKSIEGLGLSAVVQRIRGTKGTTVTLTVTREKEANPLTFPIVRADIVVPSVQWEVKQTATGSVGYIALNQFGGDTTAGAAKAITELKKDTSIKGIILDLRNNGGGYLDGAVDIVSMFLPEGRVVSVQRRSGVPDVHDVNGRATEPTIPLVVLINGGSASASEITAGALQDHKRATIIGEKSFGKGTVQEVYDLPGGSSLRVTVAQWLTPSGKNLGKEGVHPDFVVTRTKEDTAAGKDPQLEAAEAWLTEQKPPAATGSSSTK